MVMVFIEVGHDAIDASLSVVLGQPCAVDQALGKALMLYLRILYCAKRIMRQNHTIATHKEVKR